MIAALALALVSPPRTIPLAAVAGSVASIAILFVVQAADSSTKATGMGVGGAWPGFAELAGLGLLTGWRSAALRDGAIAASLSLGVALFAIVGWRNQGNHSDWLLLLCGGAWVPSWPPAGTCACSIPVRSSRLSKSATRNAWPSPASCTMSSPITSPVSWCRPRRPNSSPTSSRMPPSAPSTGSPAPVVRPCRDAGDGGRCATGR